MKKKVMFVMAMFVMSLFITGFRAAAAETTDFYTIVKNGVESDIETMKEDEDTTVLSVKYQECTTERVCAYKVEFIADEEQYTLWVYLNEYMDEAIGVLYYEDGEVDEYSHMTLSEAAQDYM